MYCFVALKSYFSNKVIKSSPCPLYEPGHTSTPTHTHSGNVLLYLHCVCDRPPFSWVTLKLLNFLSDINFALRKIVCLLKPTKDITHDIATGAMKIRTVTTFKNFNMDFNIGKEFTEDLQAVDGRTCQVCFTEYACWLVWTCVELSDTKEKCLICSYV